MHLDVWPLIFVLAGLVLYVVLGGADFGAGFWQLFARRGPHANRIRDHAHHSMGPVWEANHVWLIFVLTVTWTAYPRVFESLASTLCIPLFVAGIGIVLRGAAYAMRSGVESDREVRTVDAIFGISSILTPFALGAAVGGLASLRVPTGNAAGDLVTSWLNATSITVGILAVAVSAYLAAVYLAADAVRQGDDDLAVAFRHRALGAGAVGGLAAAAGIVVLRFDAHRLFDRLVWGPGTAAVVVSVLAGLATLGLVARRRFEPARYTAALAVAAIVAGWAVGQSPLMLRDLTVSQAAASHSTLIAVIVAVVAGGRPALPVAGAALPAHPGRTAGARPGRRRARGEAGRHARLAAPRASPRRGASRRRRRPHHGGRRALAARIRRRGAARVRRGGRRRRRPGRVRGRRRR
jgi:cytochrome d ubiquinol oxidase subunit II